jgi:hypothetical protein
MLVYFKYESSAESVGGKTASPADGGVRFSEAWDDKRMSGNMS